MNLLSKRAILVVGPLVVLFLAIVCMGAGAIRFSAIEIATTIWHALKGIGSNTNNQSNNDIYIILFQIRLPRIALSFIAGAALAPIGAAMQALFRNPLTDPYVMGVSSGASLGAALAIVGGVACAIGVGASAFAGAMLCLVMLYLLGMRTTRFDTKTLLLSGIALQMMCMSAVSMLIAFNHQDVQNIVFWTMGGFNAATWQQVVYTLAPVSLGLLILTRYANRLNILSMGETAAHTLGINHKQTATLVMVISALMVAFVVAVSGVIGFVGLVVPHIGRMWLGPNNKQLIPFSMIAGGCFVMLCDTLARTVALPTELPVGCITALIGAPYFLFMLIKKRANSQHE